MAKPKNTELNFLYMDEKYVEKKEKNQNKRNRTKSKNKKKNVGAGAPKSAQSNETFNFDNEIVIGVTRLPDEKKNTNNKVNKRKNNKNLNYSKQTIKNDKQNNKKLTQKEINEVKRRRKKQEDARKRKNASTKNNTKEVRNKSKKSKIIKKILKWTFLLSALAASFVFFMMSPLFDLATVQIVNNDKISSDTIISLSGLTIRRKYL